MLKSVYLGFRKVKVQRVTVVEFGMYSRGGDGVGCTFAVQPLFCIITRSKHFYLIATITIFIVKRISEIRNSICLLDSKSFICHSDSSICLWGIAYISYYLLEKKLA